MLCSSLGGDLWGRGAVSADNTPAQLKTPLTPPPQTPPFFKFGFGGVLSMIFDFRESPPLVFACICVPQLCLYVCIPFDDVFI